MLSDTIDYSGPWGEHAADYIDLCPHRVRAWENEWSERSAQRVRIPNFDDWLRATGRYPTH
jgi:hypothetical protein